jgi:hypothetical protein
VKRGTVKHILARNEEDFVEDIQPFQIGLHR